MTDLKTLTPNRRQVLQSSGALLAFAAVPGFAAAQPDFKGDLRMATFTTSDGT